MHGAFLVTSTGTHAVKAIIVDGSSLYQMGKILGIEKFNYVRLHQMLSRLGLKDRGVTTLMTLPEFMRNNPITKTVRAAGFDIVFCATGTEEEDGVIIRTIQDLNAKGTYSLVLVSCDQDFIPVLRQKKAEGMKITLVATKALGEHRVSMLGQAFRSLEQDRLLEIVELGSYKSVIALRSREPKSSIKYSIRLDSPETNPDVQDAILRAVKELSIQFPGLTYERLT